jgi:hypothetical protein
VNYFSSFLAFFGVFFWLSFLLFCGAFQKISCDGCKEAASVTEVMHAALGYT